MDVPIDSFDDARSAEQSRLPKQVSVAAFDLNLPAHGQNLELIGRMRATNPLVLFVAVGAPGDITLSQRYRLAHAGIDLFADAGSMSNLVASLPRHSLNAISGLMDRARSAESRLEQRSILASWRPTTVEATAEHFGVDRKTVYRVARRNGWSSAEDLLRSGRFLHAAILLDETELSCTAVAKRLGFESAVGLNKFVRRLSAQTPSELRIAGAVPQAVSHWMRNRTSSESRTKQFKEGGE